MKLAVINFSGNVGKTTVARHLLAPRIPGCQVVAVESINADDGPSVKIRLEQSGSWLVHSRGQGLLQRATTAARADALDVPGFLASCERGHDLVASCGLGAIHRSIGLL